jgi:uncharacterized protein YkwD
MRVLLYLATVVACVARADPPMSADASRSMECAGKRPGGSLIELSGTLNGVAHELSRGTALEEALERTGYRAASSSALYLEGPSDDAAIREVIEDRYCTPDDYPAFTEVGAYRSGDETWIVFAVRAEEPPVEEPAAAAARVLELVIAARAHARLCGDRRFDAAPPLALSSALTAAAARHASDLAQHGSFDHRGSDGTRPAERVSAAGYRWLAVAENIAAGPLNADAVVAGWLESPAHCANVMAARFTQMGIAFVRVPSANPPIYWTQVFAAPR